MPSFDVRERFQTTILAPHSLVMEVAVNYDLQSVFLVRAIFWLRERLMRAGPTVRREPKGLVREMRGLGWAIMVEHPGELIVCGAVCQPWLADVRFVPIPADEFASYAEPDQVKIVWTLEAEALGPAVTRFVQETRAVGTDARATHRFRRYWRWARFGIIGIRLLLLPAIRAEAQRRWAARLTEAGESRGRESVDAGVVESNATWPVRTPSASTRRDVTMWWRSIVVWLLIIACETVLGTMRQLVLVPMLGKGAQGDVPARRIGLFVGTVMIFTITWFTVRWICGVRSTGMPRRDMVPGDTATRAKAGAGLCLSRRLILIGVCWAVLTFAFEVGIGRVMAMGMSPDGGWSAVWSRLGEDYDLTRGGLMGLGLLAMALCPLLAARLRSLRRARAVASTGTQASDGCKPPTP